ncbi:diphosphoinositol polyphosphate phosphohydrolase 2 isoform X2 [Moschus berezovskii]|nr:diphosphoinositol polyphosphate phosphohydrolase 2 isoform X2 [Moschus berezovskii]
MMKFKPNQTRTYDREGFKKRAACLCFRSEQEDEVLLVSSSRYPDQWIVPGGGMEPEEEPDGAAVREVYEEAGVKGKLGRLLGIFENQDRKHRTYVYVLTVTEILEDWEDSVNIGRKREWFKVEDAIKVLQCHKPVHAEYLEKLKLGCSPTNGNSTVPSLPDSNTLFVTAAQTSGLPSSGSAQAGPRPGGTESRRAVPAKRLLPLSIRAATAVCPCAPPHPPLDEVHEGTSYASPIHLITLTSSSASIS